MNKESKKSFACFSLLSLWITISFLSIPVYADKDVDKPYSVWLGDFDEDGLKDIYLKSNSEISGESAQKASL